MPSHITKHIKDMVAEANQHVKTFSVEEASALHGRDDVVFVDLRDPRELTREGKVAGAYSCPRGMLEFWIDPESPYAKPVFQEDKTFVFYCASGWRSALAAKAAQDMGLAPVAHILGGFTAWKAAEKPVEVVESKAK